MTGAGEHKLPQPKHAGGSGHERGHGAGGSGHEHKHDAEDHGVLHAQLFTACIFAAIFFASQTLIWGSWDFAMQEVSGPRVLGFVKSATNAVGVVCSTPIGRIADARGPNCRWHLLVFFMGLACFGLSIFVIHPDSLLGLCSGMVVLTVCMNADEMAKTYLADRTAPSSPARQTWIVRCHAAVAAGTFAGSRTSGWLKARYSCTLSNLSALSAAIVGIAAAVGVAFEGQMKTSIFTISEQSSDNLGTSQKNADAFLGFRSMLKHSTLRWLLCVRFLMSVQFHLAVSSIGLIVSQGLGGNSTTLDSIISIMSGGMFFIQALFIPFVNLMQPKPGSALCLAILMAALGRAAIAALGRTFNSFVCMYLWYMLGQAWYLPAITESLTSHAPHDAIATVVGFARSLESFAAVACPLVSGQLVHYFGPFSPMALASIFCFGALCPSIIFAAREHASLKKFL